MTLSELGYVIIFLGGVTAALGVLWTAWGKPVHRWFLAVGRTVESVDEQLRINGHEHELPLALRGLPLRTLLISRITSAIEQEALLRDHIVTTAPMIERFLEEHPDLATRQKGRP